MELDVHDVPEQSRYEAYLDRVLAGYAAYELTDQLIVFTHTVVEPGHGGRGVGDTLIRAALDNVRARHLTVVPRCPFARAWIDSHPEYADLERPQQP